MNTKNLFASLAMAVITSQTLPAFAQSSPELNQDSAQLTQVTDEAATDSSANSPFETEARRPHRPRRPPSGGPVNGPGYPGAVWVCYSHDFFGQQYYGQSRIQEQARRIALRACQVYSQTPVTVCFEDGCELGY